MKAIQKQSTTAATVQRKSEQPFFQKQGEEAAVAPEREAFLSGGDKTGVENRSDSPFFQKPSRPVIQAKLTIGQPGDPYEQEADAMAEKVVQRLAENNQTNPVPLNGNGLVSPKIQRKPIFESNTEPTIQAKFQASSAQTTPLIQAKCAECEQEEKLQKKEEPGLEEQVQMKPIFESNGDPPETPLQPKLEHTPFLQKQCAECAAEEETPGLQKQADSTASTAATPSLESRLSSSRGGGSPLPENTRTQMEGAFGSDFSGVRVHSDSSAVQMNKELGAQAFTHGSDVYFNAGKYDDGSTEGQRLLGHELTHVVQQNQGFKTSIQRLPANSKREYSDGSKGKGVLHYTDIDSKGNPYEKYLGYRKEVIAQFEADAKDGKDMDEYTGRLVKDEYYVISMKARMHAVLSVSQGDYVSDEEEAFINNLIEYVLQDEKLLLKRLIPGFYKEVFDELDDEEQQTRFNRLMNELGEVNTEAIKQVREELQSGDFDLDDNTAKLGVKDLRQLSVIERVNLIRQIGINDWVVTDEDGDTVIRIIESLEGEADPKSFFKYLHSAGANTLYNKLIDNLTGAQTSKYYALLGKFYPDVPDIAKYKKLDALVKLTYDKNATGIEIIEKTYQKSESDNIVATFSEFDYINLEANDKQNKSSEGTFRLSLIKDLLEGFTGDDDENSLINLISIWPNDGGVTGKAKTLITNALLDKNLALLRAVHFSTHGEEYGKLKKALEGLFRYNERFTTILLNAIDGTEKDNLETIAHYTPKAVLTTLPIEKKVALVKAIEAGWWTDGWDEETLLYLFEAVRENSSQEERQEFYDKLDKEVGIAEVKDDFQGDNYAFSEQALNSLDDAGSTARIDALMAANPMSLANYFSYDDTVGALTDKDLQSKRITLEVRKRMILGIIGPTPEAQDNSVVGDYDEMTIIRIIKNTPASQAAGMVQWLGDKKGAVYQYLHRAIDGLEFEQFHAALNDLSKMDYFMGALTGMDPSADVDQQAAYGSNPDYIPAPGDFEKLRGRQNQIHEIRSLGLKHEKVVPFAQENILSELFTAKVSVQYNVYWSDNGRITVAYDYSGLVTGEIRYGFFSDINPGSLSGQKTFDASEMIGVYFLYDDADLKAKAGETKIMAAFNLFNLKNTQLNRQLWEAADILLLLVGVAEFKAATKLSQMIIAGIDIALSSATIIQSNFRNNLPADIRDAIDYANMIFGGYMLLKLGSAGIKMGKKALDNLIAGSSRLTAEERKAMDALIEGYRQQLLLAEKLQTLTPEELQALRAELRGYSNMDEAARLEFGRALDDLGSVAGNIDPASVRYVYNGVEVPESIMLELLRDHEGLRATTREGTGLNISLQNASPEVTKAHEEAMAALGDSDAGKMLNGADGTKALPDGSTKGAVLAKKLGYPNPEPGFHWAEVNGELVYKRNPFNAEGPKLPERYYDPESKSFKNVEPKAPADVLIDGDLITKAQKGKFGEQKAIEFMDQEGFVLRGSHDAPGVGGGNPKPQGIDGVYENMKYPPPPKWVVGEAKFGDSGYGWTRGRNGDPVKVKQLSTPWTNDRLEHAVGRKLADQIRLEGYERWELRVDPSGKVTKTKITW